MGTAVTLKLKLLMYRGEKMLLGMYLMLICFLGEIFISLWSYLQKRKWACISLRQTIMYNCHAKCLTALAGWLWVNPKEEIMHLRRKHCQKQSFQSYKSRTISQQCKHSIYTVNITANEWEQRAELCSKYLYHRQIEKERYSRENLERTLQSSTTIAT